MSLAQKEGFVAIAAVARADGLLRKDRVERFAGSRA